MQTRQDEPIFITRSSKELREQFCSVSKNIVLNNKISMKAKAVYVILSAMDDLENTSIKQISQFAKETKDTINSALQELESNNLLKREQANKNGVFMGTNYIIYEPLIEPYPKKPYTENQDTVEIKEKDKENSFMVSLNNPILNTKVITKENYLSKEESKKNEKSLTHNSEDLSKQNCKVEIINEIDDMFSQFWKAYPHTLRKTDKKKCRVAFERISHLKDEFPNIMGGLEIWKQSKDWQKDNGQYICAPLVFLHQRRWESANREVEKIEEKQQDDYEMLKLIGKGWNK